MTQRRWSDPTQRERQEAEVVADVFQDAGWSTTSLRLGRDGWKFNAHDRDGGGGHVTVKILPANIVILPGVSGISQRRWTALHNAAHRVLSRAGLGAHVTS
jgi:hypothetical protein